MKFMLNWLDSIELRVQILSQARIAAYFICDLPLGFS